MTKYPFSTWAYEEQTKMKHCVLNEYIDKWIKIVGKNNNLNYIDSHGGIGAYLNDNNKLFFGSPVLVAQTVEEITKKHKRNVAIVIIDKEERNLKNIQLIFDYLKINIKPIFINDDFDKTLNKFVDEIEHLAPTFFFIDPFGFKIKMKTLKKIIEIPKSEILLMFMFTRINEFLSAPKLEKTLDDLFDGTEWRIYKKKEGIDREIGIIDYYKTQLKKFVKFVNKYRFEFPDKKRTYYYLYHLTNHKLGCSIMKSAFAKYNEGRIEYKGKRSNQLNLFENEKINDVKKYLKNKYSNKKILYGKIIEENIDCCDFLEKDLYNALKELENNEEIKIIRMPQKTPTGRVRTSIQDKDIIIFYE